MSNNILYYSKRNESIINKNGKNMRINIDRMSDYVYDLYENSDQSIHLIPQTRNSYQLIYYPETVAFNTHSGPITNFSYHYSLYGYIIG